MLNGWGGYILTEGDYVNAFFSKPNGRHFERTRMAVLPIGKFSFAEAC
jgi:hypothetical protein